AARFNGEPSGALSVVGVTGTNGKTTVTHMLRSVLEAHGWPTAVVGTLGGMHATPEAPDLQSVLARLRDDGRRAVAMEVSSHALDQHRVDGVRFAVAVFTNLSQDHLDHHGTMDAYFAAKASLFEPGRAARGVVNGDDAFGRRLLEAAPIPLEAFSLADVSELTVGAGGSTFVWSGQRVDLHLGGLFNVGNALAAAVSARALGVDAATVADGLGRLTRVPGRFEAVDQGQPFSVVVDYAHTPGGLEQVLAAARDVAGAEHRVIVVFGAGGDRDRAKRPLMGEAATRLADVVVVTTDNPRGEDPMAIIADVLAGVPSPQGVVVEPDRAEAIRAAIGQARAGDVVVLAGKGHEDVQVFADRSVPFDDREVARAALAGLAGERR
ncbi:MAG TPA: UDP-N-acetylmuramoyl-L-alanyl-D-glutamate--2,6-diaminopimelate ligase, partial [Acidimicrobiales bacterium]|nr:UDP-N-acetylmuramoyl-L-alanyl-D-glutamate--2,6-diaminopimelate ligase [Acidimicrobiales bacterium]